MYKIIKNVYKIRLKEIFLKLATNEQSDKVFLFTSKFCPQGVVCPCPGDIYICKIINEAKGIFLELVQNDENNKSFKMLPELVPSGCMPMPWGYIYMYEIVKKCKISLPAQDQVSVTGPVVLWFYSVLTLGFSSLLKIVTVLLVSSDCITRSDFGFLLLFHFLLCLIIAKAWFFTFPCFTKAIKNSA